MTKQTIPLLRTSERRDFKRCPQRWWWGWREGLRPKGTPSDALWFGTGWHLVMEHHYCGPGAKRGGDPHGVWEEYVADEIRFIRSQVTESNGVSEEPYQEAGELGHAMVDEYLRVYGDDEQWSIIRPEKAFQVYIKDPDTKRRVVKYCGTYDLVARDESDGQLWLWDHKTAKAISTSHLALDDQAGSYCTIATQELRAAGLIGKNEKIAGILYNFIRKGKPDPRPTDERGRSLNKDGSISKSQPAPLFKRELVYRTPEEQRSQLSRIRAEVAHMDAFRSRSLPLYKNPTRDCSWDCSFYHLCTIDEQVGPEAVKEVKDAMFDRADPYADHRESAYDG